MQVRHIAFIMDGNRRYAKSRGLATIEGHKQGSDRFSQVISWLKELGIAESTFYVFSTENFNRSSAEKKGIFELFYDAIRRLLRKIKEGSETVRNVCFRFVGNLSLFPEKLQKLCNQVADLTRSAGKLIVNLAIGYGGRNEIAHAVRRIASKVEQGQLSSGDITEELVGQHLGLRSEPDIVVRTGGHKRLSNFFPWQTAYSEWFFLDTLWPELTKADVVAVLDEFALRKRNFGA